MRKLWIISLLFSLMCTIGGCDLEDSKLIVLKDEVKIVDRTMMVYSDGKDTYVITDFSPNPLPDGESLVEFKIGNQEYSAILDWDPSSNTNVHVTNIKIRTVDPSMMLSGNMGVWVSEDRLTSKLEELVIATGPSIMRFPGGNISNNYCFISERVYSNDFTTFTDWSNTMGVEPFLEFIKKIGLVPMYTVSPFNHIVSGTTHNYVDEAVELVSLIKSHGFGGAYYEVGNENNGSWTSMLSIEEYTNRYIEIAEAIKLEDSDAKLIGPVMGGVEENHIEQFIEILISRNSLHLVDYISYHDYGIWIPNNSGSIDLNQPKTVVTETAELREFLDSNGGEHIGIAITEFNAAVWESDATVDRFTIKQALWTSSYTGELFQSQADIANIWITFQDGRDPHALISSDNVAPTKNYWATTMMNRVFGSISEVDVLEVTTSNTNVSAYAVKKSDGLYGVVIVNKGLETTKVAITIDGSIQDTVEAWVLSEKEYNSIKNASPFPISWNQGVINFLLKGESIVYINLS